ncbi:hypothetical protein ABFS83_08G046600 [Erythranthe nasuta]
MMSAICRHKSTRRRRRRRYRDSEFGIKISKQKPPSGAFGTNSVKTNRILILKKRGKIEKGKGSGDVPEIRTPPPTVDSYRFNWSSWKFGDNFRSSFIRVLGEQKPKRGEGIIRNQEYFSNCNWAA